MVKTKHYPVYLLCLLSGIVISCGEKEEPVVVANTECLKAYEIEFECDDIDADAALLFYDQENNKGWFGWATSNGGSQNYILRQIESLNFTEAFPELWGVDKGGEHEDIEVSFNISIDAAGEVSGTGKFTNGDGSIEDCALSSRENNNLQTSDACYLAKTFSFSCDQIETPQAVVIYDDANSVFFGWQGNFAGKDNFAIKEMDEDLQIEANGFSIKQNFNGFYGVSADNATETVIVDFEIEVNESSISLSGELTRADGTVENCSGN